MSASITDYNFKNLKTLLLSKAHTVSDPNGMVTGFNFKGLADLVNVLCNEREISGTVCTGHTNLRPSAANQYNLGQFAGIYNSLKSLTCSCQSEACTCNPNVSAVCSCNTVCTAQSWYCSCNTVCSSQSWYCSCNTYSSCSCNVDCSCNTVSGCGTDFTCSCYSEDCSDESLCICQGDSGYCACNSDYGGCNCETNGYCSCDTYCSCNTVCSSNTYTCSCNSVCSSNTQTCTAYIPVCTALGYVCPCKSYYS